MDNVHNAKREEIKNASRIKKLKIFLPDVYELANKICYNSYGLSLDDFERLQSFELNDEDIEFETIISNKEFSVKIYNSALPSNNVNKNLLIKNYGVFKPLIQINILSENSNRQKYSFYVSETNVAHPYVYCKSSDGKVGLTKFNYCDDEIGVYPVSINALEDVEEIVK